MFRVLGFRGLGFRVSELCPDDLCIGWLALRHFQLTFAYRWKGCYHVHLNTKSRSLKSVCMPLFLRWMAASSLLSYFLLQYLTYTQVLPQSGKARRPFPSTPNSSNARA